MAELGFLCGRETLAALLAQRGAVAGAGAADVGREVRTVAGGNEERERCESDDERNDYCFLAHKIALLIINHLGADQAEPRARSA